ncbi:hypothetical protein [Bianquea renquensis]|uniref:Uncharacterized protein n=1 Tax=Bianquea renquensis TaxID=2763661 RepID=A0A926DSC4_9FIRM|nr:hypothetical protein [Bianquea renquensis]MBC8544375.1 hypothetical protein [Bianquea renquensis]
MRTLEEPSVLRTSPPHGGLFYWDNTGGCLFPDSPLLYAGVAKNDSGQQAHGGKLPTGIVETILPAERHIEKCTPAR